MDISTPSLLVIPGKAGRGGGRLINLVLLISIFFVIVFLSCWLLIGC